MTNILEAQTVYRAEIDVRRDSAQVRMDHESRIVAVEAVGENAVDFWFTMPYHHSRQDLCLRRFAAVGTGHPFPESARYLGCSGRTPAGFVWHLLELPA